MSAGGIGCVYCARAGHMGYDRYLNIRLITAFALPLLNVFEVLLFYVTSIETANLFRLHSVCHFPRILFNDGVDGESWESRSLRCVCVIRAGGREWFGLRR
jgi:hypothetical protein